MALVIDIAASLRWPNLALLAVAVVMFLQVVQLDARARGYAVTPAQAREWYPDYDDPQRRAVVARELRHHRARWVYLVRRTRIRYNLGILALLFAIVVALVPRASLQPWRVVAVAVIATGALLELLEVVAGRRRGRALPGWLQRGIRWLAPADPPA